MTWCLCGENEKVLPPKAQNFKNGFSKYLKTFSHGG
jgi:hypothetical protein